MTNVRQSLVIKIMISQSIVFAAGCFCISYLVCMYAAAGRPFAYKCNNNY